MKHSIAQYLSFVVVAFNGLGTEAQVPKGDNPFGTSVYPTSYTAQASADASAGNDAELSEDPDEQRPALASFISSGSASANDSGERATAQAQSSYTATASLDTSTGVLSGTFSANASGSGRRTQLFKGGLPPSLGGNAIFVVRFTVEGAPALLTMSGSGSVSGTPEGAGGSATVSVNSSPIFLLPFSLSVDDGTETSAFSETLTLEPRGYSLSFQLGSDAQFPEDDILGMLMTSASLNANFTLTSMAGTEFFWNVNDGDYAEASNWEPQQVPGPGQIARFDRDASYTVMMDLPETGRALIERGTVTFDAIRYTLSDGTEDEPSLVVGTSTEQLATLNFGGSAVDTIHALVGQDFVAEGRVESDQDGTWTNQGRLSIGGTGTGTVSIANNARLETGELRLGDEADGDGRLEILDGVQATMPTLMADATAIGLNGTGVVIARAANVQTGATQLGAFAGSSGTLTLEDSTEIAFWDLAGELVIGNEGAGTVTVGNGNTLRSMLSQTTRAVIANAAGSTGSLAARGGFATFSVSDDIIVGAGGAGSIRADDQAGIITGPAQLGLNPGASGVATMNNAEWSIDGILTLGEDSVEDDPGRGTIEIYNGGVIECDHVVGFPESAINGNGTLRVRSTESSLDGVSLGPVRVDVLKQDADESPGTLTIDGDIVLQNSTITIDVAGTTADQFDVMEITGNADLTNTTVNFHFIEGYLPQTGDELEFLTAANLILDGNTTTTYSGAADGFQFNLMNVGNSLMFQAQSNAQPEDAEGGGEPAGAGEGEGENPQSGCAAVTSPNTAFNGWVDLLTVLGVICSLMFFQSFLHRKERETAQ